MPLLWAGPDPLSLSSELPDLCKEDHQALSPAAPGQQHL